MLSPTAIEPEEASTCGGCRVTLSAAKLGAGVGGVT